MTVLPKNKTILIVEDEGIIAKDLQHSLEALGYHVPATASSCEEAIRLTAEVRPALVIMDIQIKGDRDGIETALLLRERFKVSVVYLTAHADVATVARATATEPDGYLLKPLKADELRNVIQGALHEQAEPGVDRFS